MQRAVVVRIHGDQAMGSAIAKGMEANAESHMIQELESQLAEAHARIRQLEARLGVMSYKNAKDYRKKIDEMNQRYRIRQHSKLYDKLTVFIGTLWLIHTEGGIS